VNVEQLILPVIRQIGSRPRLSKQLFRFAQWGDPFTPERFSWPYPIYDKMTANGPVVYSRPYQQWFVSGHDEVLDVLRSPNVSTAAVGQRILSVSPYTKLSQVAVDNFSNWLLVNDPLTTLGCGARSFVPSRPVGSPGTRSGSVPSRPSCSPGSPMIHSPRSCRTSPQASRST
jgi:hypothetical protein